MSKAEQIIKKHIAELEHMCDSLIDYELEMADMGCPLSKAERDNNDRKWKEFQARRYELIEVLAEIENVAVEDVVW